MTRPNKSQQRPAVIEASRTLKSTGRSIWVHSQEKIPVASGIKPQTRLVNTLKNIGGMPMDRLKVIQILHELGYELPTIEQLEKLKETQELKPGLYWVKCQRERLWDPENNTLNPLGNPGKVWVLGLLKSSDTPKAAAKPVVAQPEPSVEAKAEEVVETQEVVVSTPLDGVSRRIREMTRQQRELQDRYFEIFYKGDISKYKAHQRLKALLHKHKGEDVFDELERLKAHREELLESYVEVKQARNSLKGDLKEILKLLTPLREQAEELSALWKAASSEEKYSIEEQQAQVKDAREPLEPSFHRLKEEIHEHQAILDELDASIIPKAEWRWFVRLFPAKRLLKEQLTQWVRENVDAVLKLLKEQLSLEGLTVRKKRDLFRQKQAQLQECLEGLEASMLKDLSAQIPQGFDKLQEFAENRIEAILKTEIRKALQSLEDLIGDETRSTINRIDRIIGKLNQALHFFVKAKDGISKTQWATRYRQLTRDFENYLDTHQAEDDFQERLDSSIKSLERIAIERIKAQVEASHEVYQAIPQISFKFTAITPHQLGITLEDGFEGRMAGAAAVIGQILGDDQFTASLRAWKLDWGGIPEELIPKAWEAIATVCKRYRMIGIANNGSRCLVKIFEDGSSTELSGPAKFLEALFENFSEYGAYGLSLLNAQPQDKYLGGPHHEPINGIAKEGERPTVSILYDSRALDWLPGVDGSGLNSLGYTGQHRCFMLNKRNGRFFEETLSGAFFKGLGADSRVTLLDGRPWSVQDIQNVRWLSKEELSEMFEPNLVKEIQSLNSNGWGQIPTSVKLTEALDATGHFVSMAQSEQRLRKLKMERWDSWFESRKDLPRLFALEVGQLKGKGKRTLAQVMPQLQDNTYVTWSDKGKNRYALEAEAPEGVETKVVTNLKVDALLEAHGGWLPLTSDLYGWSIIDSPDKSAMALNYQPQAPIIYSPEELQELDKSYDEKTREFFESFREHKNKSRIQAFLTHMLQDKAQEFVDWPTAVMKNPVASLWRWTTNFDITQNATKRLLMVDYGVNRFTGLMLVEGNADTNVCRVYNEELGKTQEVVRRCASWRAPLIVPSAIQAPYAITGNLAARLLDAWRRRNDEIKDEHKEKHEADLAQLELIIERLAFKRKETPEVIKDHLEGILKALIKASCLVKLGKQLVIIDVSDAEDMQADDDGDTVVAEFNETLAKRFDHTEQWWSRFYEANGLRPIKIEMTKANRIDFGMANSLYAGEDLTEDQKAFVRDFGIFCPKVAEHYGLEGGKIPNPLGASFSTLVHIENVTEGKLLANGQSFMALVAKLGSTPTGPIGAGSDIAPDLLIRALAQTDKDLKLNDYGRRLYQGYATMASTVQVSIDWAKRVYRILNAALYDQEKDDGSWLINFENEITPEAAQDYLLANTFQKVFFVRFKACRKVDKKVQTLAYKTVRFVVDHSPEPTYQYAGDILDFNVVNSLDSGTIYSIHNEQIESLKNSREDLVCSAKPEFFIQMPARVSEVDLLDESNSCFSFGSMYEVGSFMIQPRLENGFKDENGELWNSTVQAASWKKPIGQIFSSSKRTSDPIKEGISAGASNSALVAHFTRMLDHVYSGDEGKLNPELEPLFSISKRLQQAFNDVHKETPASVYLDAQWPFVSRAIAAFFSEEHKRADRGDLNKGRVLSLAFKNFGLDSLQTSALMSKQRVTLVRNKEEIQLTIVDILSCVFRNDASWTSEKVPQSLGQMMLQEYFDKNEENPFVDYVDGIVDGTIRRLKDRMSAPFIQKARGNKTTEVLKNPLKPGNLPKEFFDGEGSRIPQKIVEALISEGLLKKEVKTRDDRNSYVAYSWSDDKAPFRAMAFILLQYKKLIFGNDQLWQGISHIWVQEITKVPEDQSKVAYCEQLKALMHSAVKNAAARFDSDIRTWLSYAQQEEVTPNLIGRDGAYNSTYRKAFSQAFRNGEPAACWEIMRDTRPENFANVARSNEQLYWAWVGGQRLPQAQVSRSTLSNAIAGLANVGILVKSWSYYSSVAWQSPYGIQAFMAHNNLEYFIQPNQGECPTLNQGGQPLFDQDLARDALFRTTVLNMEGAHVRRVQRTCAQYAEESRRQKLSAISERLYSTHQGFFGTYKFRNGDGVIEELFRYLSQLKSEVSALEQNKGASGFQIIRVKSPGAVWEWEGKRYYNVKQLINDIKSKVAL